MKNIAAALGIAVTLVIVTLSVVIAPDTLSLVFVGLMLLLMFIASLLGVIPNVRFSIGFRNARRSISRILESQPNAPWLYVQQNEYLFGQKELDRMFGSFITRAQRELKEGRIISDIEDTINEDSIALRNWHGLLQLIPGTLTAIGLAGTFIGLIFGISSIGFSSIDATIGSIEVLLSGIRTAFYTSIIGLVFSILFNIINKTVQQNMLREMGLFTEQFHLYVLPSAQEQTRQKQDRDIRKILTLLERLPSTPGFSISEDSANHLAADIQSEQQLMQDIQNGMQNGEFVFYVQPRCDLTDSRVTAGEALMRWNNKQLGMVSPVAFLPVLERNGYIARIDRYIWTEVCKAVRAWLDESKKVVPISINISKTDILTMDIAAVFTELTRTWHVPPKYLELEIAGAAFLQCGETVRSLEEQLRQSGFRVIIDGFTGEFSAMNALRNANVDAFKLDLHRLSHGESSRKEFIASVYEQAAAIHLPITVEGIENADDLNTVRRCGIREGQGYHLHRPMTMEAFVRMIEEQA